jgi:DNA-binding MarR family transcriptional regulator
MKHRKQGAAPGEGAVPPPKGEAQSPVALTEPREIIVTEILKLLPDLARGLNRAVAAHCDVAGPARPVTTAMMRALVHLARYGEQTMGELAEGLKITTASATGLVEPLVEMGYVTRRRDPHDRRVVRIALTEEARATAESILAGLRSEVEAALAELDDEACLSFLSGLERLTARWR